MGNCYHCGREISPPKFGFVLTPDGKLYCIGCGIDEPGVREFLSRTPGDEIDLEMMRK